MVGKALDNLELVLDQELPSIDSDNYMKMLSMKKDAAMGVVTAGLRADENRFRKRDNDVLGRLLKTIKESDARKQGMTIEGDALPLVH